MRRSFPALYRLIGVTRAVQMQPFFTFSDDQRDDLKAVLARVQSHPYRENAPFRQHICAIAEMGGVIDLLRDTLHGISRERENGDRAHVLRNCPVDDNLPILDNQDPVADKHRRKTTFIGEAFLALIAEIGGSPIVSYTDRSQGDFFTDVVEITKFKKGFTGYSGGDLVYHVDRAPHDVRSDYVNLLGMRCPDNNLVYTNFIDVQDLLSNLSPEEQAILREPLYVTQVDTLSRSLNAAWVESKRHAIIGDRDEVRYIDTLTTTIPDVPVLAKDGLIAFKSAIARAPRRRHRIVTGDLFCFPNKFGLHNREMIEEPVADESRQRWLLKIYTFQDLTSANEAVAGWGNRACMAV